MSRRGSSGEEDAEAESALKSDRYMPLPTHFRFSRLVRISRHIGWRFRLTASFLHNERIYSKPV